MKLLPLLICIACVVITVPGLHAYEPSVENALASLEYGHLSPVFPDYVIMYSLDKEYPNDYLYIYTKSSEGYPESCRVVTLVPGLMKSWTEQQIDTWVHTWDSGRLLTVEYLNNKNEVEITTTCTWNEGKLEKALIDYGEESFKTVTFNYTGNTIQEFESTWIDPGYDDWVVRSAIEYMDGNVKTIQDFEEKQLTATEVLSYDRNGYIQKAENPYEIHRYFYKAYDDSKSYSWHMKKHRP
jgi:hypothetical protein